jgi:NMD protein affecting ribosome stability and mRNA decay
MSAEVIQFVEMVRAAYACIIKTEKQFCMGCGKETDHTLAAVDALTVYSRCVECGVYHTKTKRSEPE